MRIAFIDLASQNREIAERMRLELEQIHSNTSYVGGEQVEKFEQEFARFLGVKRVVGLANGTDALRLSLLALGIGRGDEVITVPMTFIATAAAIVQTGAKPVFVDIDPETCNMSVPALRQMLKACSPVKRKAIKAIVPVHLYGLPAPMAELKDLADEFDLKIVEDACQAHGARVRMRDGWAKAGTIGNAGCFSFYPGKNLGAWGDGGAVATDDEELAQRISLLGNHGRLSHYAHELCGYNSRLDSLQAAVVRAKLEKLDEWNSRRRTIATVYREMLAPLGVCPIPEPQGFESCFHLFVVRSTRRDAIRSALIQNEIGCGIHYPVPLHLQPALSYLGHRHGDFPHSEALADIVVSLPMHPTLAAAEIVRTVEVVSEALAEKPKSYVGKVDAAIARVGI
ncbi:MAG: DegT/DnrJ/EryC1/StrS family aminotransferase [Candidatus Binataceae bacterium]|nr:DegT/DnrJ/EryC1/StrS family aminotransferase [Candidatus Binataceae bacterium]